MKRAFAIAAALGMALSVAGTAADAADIAKGRKKLGEIVLGNKEGNDFAVEGKEITMEGGKSYRLLITSNGGKEYKFMAPEFFRNVWVNQIVINNIEIHPYGAPYALEFDVAGTVEFDFVPIRTGTYEWFVSGLQEQGMTGKLVVE
jgi:uncharacterized cupredoxin-like copper-binding protein